MNGSKPFPQERFDAFAAALDLDDAAQILLRQSILYESVKGRKVASTAVNEIFDTERKYRVSPVADYQEIGRHEFPVLSSWYNLAVLDLVTCVDFRPNPEWIAERLDLTIKQAGESLSELINHGLIEERDGRWRKVAEKVRFPTTRSHSSIRTYHRQMIEKALRILLNETNDVAFNRRLINSLSFAANPANLKKAKEHLVAALYEVAEILSEGECTEVYQLNSQLFPLTRFKP